MKNTPGPWTVASGSVYAGTANRLLLADRDNPRTTPSERDANIRLAAAAPELLAALQDVMSDPYFARSSTRYIHARAAISKATA